MARTATKVTFGMLALGLVASIALGARFVGHAGARASDDSALGRAEASYKAMQTYFAVQDGSQLYLEWYPRGGGDNAYSYEWPFSQARIATIDLSQVQGPSGGSYASAVQDRNAGQERYWNTTGATGLPGYDSYARPPYGNGGDKFYDDNEWVALADIQLYLVNGDQGALDRAKHIFSLVVSGWDTDATHADPGGVFWTQASWSHDRNTVSNMPGAEVGLRLYQITGDQQYLTWAQKMYDWTNKYLLSPEGLYWDHVNLSGNVDKTYWSYNQGVPVGVNVLLYQITGDAVYLQRAEKLADAALQFYVADGALYTQPPYFNSIFFKNLLLLSSVNHNERYVQAMRDYADQVWNHYRNPSTGLFHFQSAGQTQLLEQAAMTQIYAVLSWDPKNYDKLY